MSKNSVGTLSFYPRGTVIYRPKIVKMLSENLKHHMHAHNYQILMQDGAPSLVSNGF